MSHAFSSSADCFLYFFQEYLQSVEQSDLDTAQARQNVGPDLGPYCIHVLSTDDKNKELNPYVIMIIKVKINKKLYEKKVYIF